VPIRRNMFSRSWSIRTLRLGMTAVLPTVAMTGRELRARGTDSRSEPGFKARICPSKLPFPARSGVGRGDRCVREIGGLAGANAAGQVGQVLVYGADRVECGALCSPPGLMRGGIFRGRDASGQLGGRKVA